MSTPPPFDPELVPTLEQFYAMAPVSLTPEVLAQLPVAPVPGLDELLADHPLVWEEVTVPGDPDVILSVVKKKDHQPAGPGIYMIHGGGMVMGNRNANIPLFLSWVLEHDAVLVSVEYRLAPQHPDPAPIDDCYAGLVWTAANASSLGFDPARLIIVGRSAGGGLAAGAALMARDKGGPQLFAQILICPMLDDRFTTVSSQQFEGIGVWDRVSNETGWDALLGSRRGTDDVSIYAAPSRATDLSGLPPTYLECGSAETFRDEDIAYAQQIWADGGVAELHVWPGGYHGYDAIVPDAYVSTQAREARDRWLRRQLSP